MKTIISFTTALALALILGSCHFDDDDFFHGHCVKGVGNIVETTIKVPSFDGVLLTTDVKVNITQGSPQKVVVSGENNIIDVLFLKVDQGVLEIGFTECVNRHNLEIDLTMPDIELVNNSGSGEIYGTNFFDVPEIVLRNTGSGNINLGLNTDEIDAAISGSGNIDIEGETEYLYSKISGSGDIHAFKLKSNKANVQVTGSGDADVWVIKVLDVKISGSGSVYYKGKPVINFNRTGSGNLVDAN
jgi:hypothetical protein